MSMDIGRLQIEKIIVHLVPQHLKRSDNTAVSLSQVESTIDDELRIFFQERIRDSFTKDSVDAVLDVTLESPAPTLIGDHFAGNESDFVAMSQTLALYLFECQSGSNPAGILAVIQGSAEGKQCLVILKLEQQSGISLKESFDDIGRATFDIEEVKNLMLTKNTRVFKAGCFVQHADSIDTIAGMISDFQRTHHTFDIATFFLRTFLGCKNRNDPKQVTKEFFELGQRFVNDVVEDPERQQRYTIALIAEMSNNEQIINPFEYAERNLIGADRERLLAYLKLAGYPVDDAITKDTARIQPQLKQMTMNFVDGLSLTGTPDGFSRVSVITEDSGETVTQIRGEVTTVYAGKRRT